MESPIAHFPDEVLALPNGVEKVDAMLEYLQQARVRITPEERQCLAEVVVQLSEQLKNVSGRVRGAIHIANSWSDRANYNRALTFHYQAQELIDKDKDPLLHASVLNDLATVFMRLKRLDEANRHLREAIPSAKLVGNRAMAANLMLNLASIEIVASESQESVLVEDRLQTPKAKAIMKRRSSTVEPVLGTLVNFTGMKRINARGIDAANKHVLMASIAYNLKKYLKTPWANIKVIALAMPKPDVPVATGISSAFGLF